MKHRPATVVDIKVTSSGTATDDGSSDGIKLLLIFGVYICGVLLLMLGATMIAKCNCFWFLALCCEISNYFFCGYNQDDHEYYCKLDMFLVRETIIVRPFQRN